MSLSNKVLISACLVGDKCRYNGSDSCDENALQLYNDGYAIKFCPELFAGMSIPRNPVEIINGDGYDVLNGIARIVDKDNNDYTSKFIEGAYKSLELCIKHNIKKVILKSHSPSCGHSHIYDGTFSNNLVSGSGVTAALLSNNEIEIEII